MEKRLANIITTPGMAATKIFTPSNIPKIIAGKAEWARASPINPKFLFITYAPKSGSMNPTAMATIKDRNIKSYVNGSYRNSIPIILPMITQSMVSKHRSMGSIEFC